MMPPEIPTEPDRFSGRIFGGLLAFTVIAVLACAGIVWLLADRRFDGGGERGPGAHLPAEIDAVTTEPFERRLAAERLLLEQNQAVEHGRWLDAAHTRVRLPFAVARDRYLQGGAR